MTTWDCDAYRQPEFTERGVLCFFAEQDKRRCLDLDQCRAAMAAERVRVFEHIHAKAAEGDPVMAYMAETFTRPEQLLGGEDSGSPA